MTKREQVEMQRAAVRTYFSDQYGASWVIAADYERALERLFPMPTRMRDRTLTLQTEEFGPVVVAVVRGQIWASHLKRHCVFPTDVSVMFETVEALVAAGFASDPDDVFRLQELFANPREVVEGDV